MLGAVCLAALVVAGSASGSTASPKVVEVASWIAGHPVTVACDADTNPSPFPAPPGSVATAWTFTGGNVIHVHPGFCTASTAPLGSDAFARVMDVFIHEAARARGLSDDSCVELLADLGVYDVLQRFYGVPFFSPLSEEIGAQVLALTRTLPSVYQPESCWQSGGFR